MDNVCHTLVGATLGYSWKTKKVAAAPLIGMIAANVPDLDVVSILFGQPAMFAFRRGWTHGVPAMFVWPWIVAGIAWWLIRRSDTAQNAQSWWPVFSLAAVAVISHPLLDFLNVYGMRWLMPISGEWFYGDVLFIIDPWLWAILAAGVFIARKRSQDVEAAALASRRALFGAVAYIGIIISIVIASRTAARRGLSEIEVPQDARMMVGPVPLNPFRRTIVVELDGGYRVGEVRWTPFPKAQFSEVFFPKNDDNPSARMAVETSEGRAFMNWARFPFFINDPLDPHTVHIVDARYALDADAVFGTVTVNLEQSLILGVGSSNPKN